MWLQKKLPGDSAMSFITDTEPIHDPLCIQPVVVDGLHVKRRGADCMEIEFFASNGRENIVVARVMWTSAALAALGHKTIDAFLKASVLLN